MQAVGSQNDVEAAASVLLSVLSDFYSNTLWELQGAPRAIARGVGAEGGPLSHGSG